MSKCSIINIYIYICIFQFITNQQTFIIRYDEKKCEFTLNENEGGKEFRDRLIKNEKIEISMNGECKTNFCYFYRDFYDDFPPLINSKTPEIIVNALDISCDKEQFFIQIRDWRQSNSVVIGKISEPADDFISTIIKDINSGKRNFALSFEIKTEDEPVTAEESDTAEKSGTTDKNQQVVVLISIIFLLIIYYLLIFI